MKDETQYLDLVKRVLEHGHLRETRNNSRTISTFGACMRFNLENDAIPLLTTKKVFFRGVVEELLWFIRGSTDVNELRAKNIHIWDGHSSREHLDSVGLHDYATGDIGPLYGFQWRHSGAEYNGCSENYSGKGVDQLKDVIDRIRTNPFDRRLIVCSWAPCDLNKMSLAPCHVLFQFYVDGDGGLSCSVYQRSGDVGLGVPFNIASYSILVRLVASATGLKARELVHLIGDAHIYEEHVDALKEQITRTPFDAPTLRINKAINTIEDMESLTFDDFELVDYDTHPPIAMKFVV